MVVAMTMPTRIMMTKNNEEEDVVALYILL